jgi:hypothetical protein
MNITNLIMKTLRKCCGNAKDISKSARCQWLTPVILATQEAEIRRSKVRSQLQTNSSENPHLKNT